MNTDYLRAGAKALADAAALSATTGGLDAQELADGLYA
jgi:hypothetical protein